MLLIALLQDDALAAGSAVKSKALAGKQRQKNDANGRKSKNKMQVLCYLFCPFLSPFFV